MYRARHDQPRKQGSSEPGLKSDRPGWQSRILQPPSIPDSSDQGLDPLKSTAYDNYFISPDKQASVVGIGRGQSLNLPAGAPRVLQRCCNC